MEPKKCPFFILNGFQVTFELKVVMVTLKPAVIGSDGTKTTFMANMRSTETLKPG